MALPLALAQLEAAMLDACAGQQDWPARVSAGICAGVDYAISNPEVVVTLASDDSVESEPLRRYEQVIGRLAGLLQAQAPTGRRLPVSTDEALVAGMVGLVGDHLRIGRYERLVELRADLVLLTLLPYLGFAEAQQWANRVDRSNPLA